MAYVEGRISDPETLGEPRGWPRLQAYTVREYAYAARKADDLVRAGRALSYLSHQVQSPDCMDILYALVADMEQTSMPTPLGTCSVRVSCWSRELGRGLLTDTWRTHGPECALLCEPRAPRAPGRPSTPPGGLALRRHGYPWGLPACRL